MPQTAGDFNAIRIALASPEQVKVWSYGEVTKPETINYRTLRPEKDGLFCERIFGPTKDWECYCGKYKKIRYKGVICDRCGVEVARAKVRRERMGHISLAVPVAHIWFSKGTPSRLGLLLDVSPRNLERVLYFAQYIVTEVNEEARKRELDTLSEAMESETAKKEAAALEEIAAARSKLEAELSALKDKERQEKSLPGEKEIQKLQVKLEQEIEEMKEDFQSRIDDLEDLRIMQLLPEGRFRELRDRYKGIFKAGMGAESILEILRTIDLGQLRESLQGEVHETSGQRRKKAIKRLRIVESFHKSGNKTEWVMISVLPVLPPELRPMVQLDGGRFATSDLNDLYRRVINRNNRLKRLMELQAPEIIVRNEKRMLQEAVDALIDNGRRGRAISGSHNHKLKSLSDLLRGKHGRFRQNLLGKRVDYSGRSVITVGPELLLHQCGLPKRMALELFKPFVMNRLVIQGFAHNIKSAKRMVERVRPEVWDILEDVIKDRPVLLNRAPTLHRLGIQAFQPVLVEGSAIQLHPLVCSAFNADFDGDQMAVHVPLSKEAVLEAKKVMLSTNNLLSPSSGEPIVTPTLDMVLGCFYMTMIEDGARGEGKRFNTFEEVRFAYEVGAIDLRAKVTVRAPDSKNGDTIETTPGRIVFSEVLPVEIGYINKIMDKGALKELVGQCIRTLGNERTAKILDAIKQIGFHYATQAGITIAINDIETPEGKKGILSKADTAIKQLDEQFQRGLITEEERYNTAIKIWTKASDDMTKLIEQNLPTYGGIYLMASSGAKGNIAQIKQMAGMRGLMSDPKGRIIDLPIKASFREGLSVLEYFISTHGARKGLADTALRTADSGYLTRRLIDVAQDMIILSDDCETTAGVWVEDLKDKSLMAPFADRILGRYAASDAADPSTGEILVKRNESINEEVSKKIASSGVGRLHVRSALTCEAQRGACKLCYGRNMATGSPAITGEAVGIIAAQSIGEPGTQLTMRTFHTGGVAGVDITSGLPRVEELFEARAPKGQAVLSEIDGVAEILESPDGRIIKISSIEEFSDDYDIPKGYKLQVANGDAVSVGAVLALLPETPEKKGKKAEKATTDIAPANVITARIDGKVKVSRKSVSIAWTEEEQREYLVSAAAHIVVENGKKVVAGQPLTGGPKNPQDILRIQGRDEVQNYLIEEVQKVYRSQGVSIHDKHIEVIIRQMLRKVRVETPGDTELLPGEYVDRFSYEEFNAKILAEGGEPATASQILLGITRASLNTDSFLAAASFQETARVLTNAAILGAVDKLLGLKENVIIGRLIPARLDISEDGRKRLGITEAERTAVGVLSGPTAMAKPWPVSPSGDGEVDKDVSLSQPLA